MNPQGGRLDCLIRSPGSIQRINLSRMELRGQEKRFDLTPSGLAVGNDPDWLDLIAEIFRTPWVRPVRVAPAPTKPILNHAISAKVGVQWPKGESPLRRK